VLTPTGWGFTILLPFLKGFFIGNSFEFYKIFSSGSGQVHNNKKRANPVIGLQNEYFLVPDHLRTGAGNQNREGFETIAHGLVAFFKVKMLVVGACGNVHGKSGNGGIF
jgi:hypothetical protein